MSDFCSVLNEKLISADGNPVENPAILIERWDNPMPLAIAHAWGTIEQIRVRADCVEQAFRDADIRHGVLKAVDLSGLPAPYQAYAINAACGRAVTDFLVDLADAGGDIEKLNKAIDGLRQKSTNERKFQKRLKSI